MRGQASRCGSALAIVTRPSPPSEARRDRLRGPLPEALARVLGDGRAQTVPQGLGEALESVASDFTVSIARDLAGEELYDPASETPVLNEQDPSFRWQASHLSTNIVSDGLTAPIKSPSDLERVADHLRKNGWSALGYREEEIPVNKEMMIHLLLALEVKQGDLGTVERAAWVEVSAFKSRASG